MKITRELKLIILHDFKKSLREFHYKFLRYSTESKYRIDKSSCLRGQLSETYYVHTSFL